MSEVMTAGKVSSFAVCPEQQALLAALAAVTTWGEASREVQLNIHGEFDTARLPQALQALARLHPVLAARMRQVPGFHGMRLCEDEQQPVFTLAVEPAVLSTEAAKQRMATWRGRTFSLAQGPWVDAIVLRLGEQHWRLVVAVAACLVDNTSLGLLAEGLAAAYQTPHALVEPEEGRFEEYLQWRAEIAIDEDAPQGQLYWRQHLQQAALTPAPARLPYRLGDYRGQPVQRVQVTLAEELVAGLQHQAGALAMPVSQLTQAAWWALLSRVTGQSALLASWRHDSREDYEYFANCAGVLEKNLPLNLRITPEQPFSAWASLLGGVLEQHVVWQEYWAADAASTPAAYAFAAVRQVALASPGAATWSASRAQVSQPLTELLLQFQVPAGGARHELLLDYLPDCYSAECMQRLLEQFVALLQDVARDASTPLEQLNLLGDAEQVRLLALNPRQQDAARPQLLPQRIHGWATQKPGHAAVVCNAERLTYAQLEQRVRTLAGQLASQGVKPQGRVAVALPRSSDLLVALLAIWRLGAAYVPLDPQWPLARQVEVASQADVSLVLSSTAQAAQLPGHGLAVFDPAATGEALVSSEHLQPYALQGHEAAYVLFTSGSTGVPKGVVIEHRHLANYVAAASQALGLQACKNFAFTSSVAADLGNTTLFGALYNGACLQVADEETMRTPDGFARYLQASAIDCLKIVPSHLAALLEAQQPCLPATLVLGGEAPAPSLIERIFALRPDCRVFNHYGPTEATVGVMLQALTAASAQETTIPLGQVLPGNQVYVLDARLRLVPLGVQGELYIGGRQLCRGYLNAEAQTAVFVDSPFEAGARLYRTGDLARYRPDGSLVLLGRKDGQIKLNGFRIELGEIEAELLRLQWVKAAAVIATDDRQGGVQPTAFVVLQAGQGQPQQLRSELALRLPAALLPRHIHLLEQLPRLANGKVDRHALATLAPLAAESPAEPPRNALEQLLAQRMARLLGREHLPIHQDFFVAGGHSLLAIRLVAGIRKVLRCEVSPAIVFDHPTVAGLAQALAGSAGVEAQQLEATAQAVLRLEALSPQERARLEEQAQRLREAR